MRKGDDDVKLQGIGGRNFPDSLMLAEHIEVESAGLDLAILKIL